MILLVLTGGTIGSKTDNGKINVDGKSAYRLIDMYTNVHGKESFQVAQPVDTLSENIDLYTWNKLIEFLNGYDLNQYEGVIITHGSDTLAYTSALIGMLYANTNVPICLIASDYPLEDSRSNGINNMYGAVRVIKNKINGVFIVYQNTNSDIVEIYPATRVISADTYTDAFSCYGGYSFGSISDDGKIIVNNQMPAIYSTFKHKISCKFKNRVLFISPYPAMNYDNFNLDNIKAVVHYSYHAGTACVEGSDCINLSKFAEKCHLKNIDLYFGSFKNDDVNCGDIYESTDKILNCGVIPLCNISPYAMYVKALIAYNQCDFSPKDIMLANLGGEILPPKVF